MSNGFKPEAALSDSAGQSLIQADDKEEMPDILAREEFERSLDLLRRNKTHFSMRDLYSILEKTAKSRKWLHQMLKEKLDDGSVVYDDDQPQYLFASSKNSKA